ncbi:hypothetical protein D3C76_1686950 [compost metagenome]
MFIGVQLPFDPGDMGIYQHTVTLHTGDQRGHAPAPLTGLLVYTLGRRQHRVKVLLVALAEVQLPARSGEHIWRG